ncbi:MAG: trypsin-like peptidase domain-containing protein [Planctomycetaceae bacterium]|jgi:thiol-disulfide isomerase/thioredoxin|nr:trypsin-like peptidase domain-containing protein [Planctomycetaceae bacterium]
MLYILRKLQKNTPFESKKRHILLLLLVLLLVLLGSFRKTQASDTVLLEFTADGCAACQNLDPLIQQLVAEGYTIRQVNTKTETQLTQQFQVKQLPSFVMLSQGKIIDRIDGGGDPFIMRTRLTQALQKGNELSAKQSKTPVANSLLTNSKSENDEPENRVVSASFQPVTMTQNSQSLSLPTKKQTTELSAISPDIPYLQATVRICVENPHGNDWGTGTMIDARKGDVLILTCGHIFRDSKGKGAVYVDLYTNSTPKRVSGICLFYDDALDIAFVKIQPQFEVDVIPLAPTGTSLQEGMTLLSTGCDGGDDPTIWRHRIQSLTKNSSFTKPPFPYIQVDNAPVQGRSGGGLFTPNGYLVGICVAGDPLGNEGLFVPLSVIYKELDKANINVVYQSPSITRSRQNSPIVQASGQILAQQPIQPAFQSTAKQSLEQLQIEQTQLLPPRTLQTISSAQNPNAQMPLQSPFTEANTKHTVNFMTAAELQKRLNDGDEILVIIRSKHDADRPNEVFQLSEGL